MNLIKASLNVDALRRRADQLEDIVVRYCQGVRAEQLAVDYNISKTAVLNIVNENREEK